MKIRIKKFVSFCLGCLLLVSSCGMVNITASADAQPDSGKTLKILAVGNSFSQDAMAHLYQIAASCGYQNIVLGNMYIGGCTLATHWENASGDKPAYQYQKNTSGSWSYYSNTTLLNGIKDEDWDVITLQQASGYSGVSDSYNSDLTNLVSYIEENKTNPDAKIGWHMTWAYQNGSTHSDFPKYSSDQMTMYNAIVSAVQNKILTNDSIDLVIPAGTAIQNVRSSYIGDTLTRDGYHLSYNLGRYIAALTWFKAVTGLSIDDITYVPSISEIPSEYLPIIKEAVNNAVSNPYSVTQSSYTDKSQIDLSRYNLLDWEEVGLAYWNSGNGTYSDDPQPNAAANNSKCFVCSKVRFTKEDIPVGSVLVIDSGYQYRPDGWAPSGAAAPGRPDNVTTAQVVIDEAWWANYEYRAFNVAYIGNTTDLTGITAETAAHFRIYIPKSTQNQSSEKALTDLTISGSEGNASGNAIMVSLPEGTDITALVPEFSISDKASVSPAVGTPQDFTSPVTYTVTAENGTVQTYIVMVKLTPVYDYSGYNLLDWQPLGGAYWNSGNGAYSADAQPNAAASNSVYYVCSKVRFTREELPVGSVIVVDTGYQYRPEGWAYESAANAVRPDSVTTERIVVDETWWGNYEYRAFNVSVEGASADVTNAVTETASHFRIYIPKSSEKDITGFMVENVNGTVSGNAITVTLPAGTDVTALAPVIQISDKATVSPASGTVQDFTNPVEYTVTAEDGTVQIYNVTVNTEEKLPLAGDVDLDGSVTVSDVVELRDLIMKGSSTDVQLLAGDMDGSGTLTVADVVELRDYIMKGIF